ncbi:uncharacterized protein [Rutidosis leptorrhynchoides]|uniref:uncharacterized protein n=1 Tax=Rutidosis leptorrhynchoides TaxID=125765 RepID=UPI003A9A4F71
MKIISYNIRGFGCGKESKLGPVKRLISREKPCFIALQETKLNIVDDLWVQTLWGSIECNYVQQEKVGKSGGQLLVWDTNYFEAVDAINCDRVIGVKGKWKSDGSVLNILNIYGPHDDSGEKKLWDNLSRILMGSDEAWVLCGDFNEVRRQEERLNCVFVESRAILFNNFIQSNNLIDLPLGGRLYTRVSDDGLKFSKIDRFLVSEKFLYLWNNLTLVALERKESDHCPIVLKDEEKKLRSEAI